MSETPQKRASESSVAERSLGESGVAKNCVAESSAAGRNGAAGKTALAPPALSEDLREDARFRILRLLEAQPDLSQRQIAEALGISLGSVNFCLRGLADRGMVKIRNFRRSKNRMGYAYLLTPRGLAEKTALTAAFLARRMREYEALRAEIDAIEEDLKG